MPLSIRDFLDTIEKRFPAASGKALSPLLQIGSPQKRIRLIGMTPRLYPSTIPIVVRCKYDLILTYRPFIGADAPVSLRTDAEPGASIEKLRHVGCALVAIGEWLESVGIDRCRAIATLAGLGKVRPVPTFEPVESDEAKFAVFVPKGYESAIVEAIARGGGGTIGRYSHCTFRSPGVGTYRPLKGAKPWAGKIGKLESARETRLEACVLRANLGRVLREVRAVHPYEEIAYDVYPLLDMCETNRPSLYVGSFGRPIRLRTLCARFFQVSAKPLPGEKREESFRARIAAGDAMQTVRTVAICSGPQSESDIRNAISEPIDAIVRIVDQETTTSENPQIPTIEIDLPFAEYWVLIFNLADLFLQLTTIACGGWG